MALAVALFIVVVAMALVSEAPTAANAASAPVAQCNDDTASNVGGQGIACIVTINNYVTAVGAAAAPATVSVTRCVGAAGPIAAGSGTCTTTTTTSPDPVTLVQQCNGSANGGGGVVICTVMVTNHYSGSPTVTPIPAAIYQCVGSFDTSATGTCSPVNTPGVTSVGAATVGQCNGSGNGGGTSYTCTVTGESTMTATLSVNVDQCNGSGNGGGALVRCTAAVTNQVATPAATGTATTSATPSTTATATVFATATTSASTTATPTGSATATASTSPAAATATSTSSPTLTPAVVATPKPPATGNAGPTGSGGSSQAALWLLAIGGLLLFTTGLRLAQRSSVARRQIRGGM